MESNPSIDPQRHKRYLELIERLIQCPNGQEPEVLENSPELIDAGFVQTLVQTATYFAHNNNPDGAKFLIFLARELSRQLGLYPQSQPESSTPAEPSA